MLDIINDACRCKKGHTVSMIHENHTHSHLSLKCKQNKLLQHQKIAASHFPLKLLLPCTMHAIFVCFCPEVANECNPKSDPRQYRVNRSPSHVYLHRKECPKTCIILAPQGLGQNKPVFDFVGPFNSPLMLSAAPVSLFLLHWWSRT